MTTLSSQRFDEITGKYRQLRIALVGDFCLDRYLEIDAAKREESIETGLLVHNVVHVRAQPGGAGTILNNLVALGVGELHPIAFCGEDGEGYELLRELDKLTGVSLSGMIRTPLRHTFTYCKPLVLEANAPPRELNRLDTKNWTPTPNEIEDRLIATLRDLAPSVDGIILLDQVSEPETGVVTSRVLDAVGELATLHPDVWILADSRRSLRAFPPVCFKMNLDELRMLANTDASDDEELASIATNLAKKNENPVFVSLAEQGILAASPQGEIERVRALPVRGSIDIVGAGDCVMANLAASLSADASLLEAITLANAAASVVVHQVGTTGTASLEQIKTVLRTPDSRTGANNAKIDG